MQFGMNVTERILQQNCIKKMWLPQGKNKFFQFNRSFFASKKQLTGKKISNIILSRTKKPEKFT